MRSRFRSCSIAAVAVPLLFCLALEGQNPQLETKNGRQFPTVIFSSVLWTVDPPYYSIAIDSSGTATYQSASNSVENTGVPYTVEFAVTERTRRATFNLARELDFFRDEVPASTGSPQNTYVRTLGFHDGTVSHQITYSASSNVDVQELTSVFEELSETLEFGRRLIDLHQHERDALGPELQKLQTSADQHHVRELQALVTVLRSIAEDRKLDGATRQAAEGLLQQARSPAMSHR